MILGAVLAVQPITRAHHPASSSPASAAPADSAWRGSFSLIERVTLNADTVEELDEAQRRAAVGMQVNQARATTLRSERLVRLDGTLVPRMVTGAAGALVQRATLAVSLASHLRSTELMPTRVRCETNAAEQQTTVVRTMETTSTGVAQVEDEVTATNLGIEVLGPKLMVRSRMASKVMGDDVCGSQPTDATANDQRDEFEHEQELERYSVDIAPDPRYPNVSVGSRVERLGAVTRTWTWALTRGLATEALAIERVVFEQQVFPDTGRWRALGPDGTVDGNVVRVRITVRNDGARAVADMLTLSDLAAPRALPNGRVPVQVAARSTSTVEYAWNTAGWAWEPNARALASRRIEVRLASGVAGAEAITTPVVVTPRPVVLVHGLWSDASTWQQYPAFLRQAHSFAWGAYAVGDGRVGGPELVLRTGVLRAGALLDETNSLFVNAHLLARYVTAVRTGSNAWQVDVVGHSMGGLIARLYLTMAPPGLPGTPAVRHLLMLGTPNLGSPCAVPLNALGGGGVEAYRQLTPEVAEAFNARVRDVPAVQYAILAGAPLPKFPCQDGPLSFTPNDGVVSVPSAFAWYHDRVRSGSLHTDMTGSAGDFRQFVLPRLAVPPNGD